VEVGPRTACREPLDLFWCRRADEPQATGDATRVPRRDSPLLVAKTRRPLRASHLIDATDVRGCWTPAAIAFQRRTRRLGRPASRSGRRVFVARDRRSLAQERAASREQAPPSTAGTRDKSKAPPHGPGSNHGPGTCRRSPAGLRAVGTPARRVGSPPRSHGWGSIRRLASERPHALSAARGTPDTSHPRLGSWARPASPENRQPRARPRRGRRGLAPVE